MLLLVSVVDEREARAALQGGADVIDAKDPRHGGLGAVGPAVLHAIRAAVPGDCPLSAALGDARDERAVARGARAAATARVGFVKVGFAGVAAALRVRRCAVAARRGAGPGTAVVLVAYADWQAVSAPPPYVLLAAAAATGVAGVLLDTAGKHAPLFTHQAPEAVGAWIAAAHDAGLFAGLAGSLCGSDFPRVRALGADLVGVRGAACVGGRTGRVSPARVAALRALAGAPPRPLAAALV